MKADTVAVLLNAMRLFADGRAAIEIDQGRIVRLYEDDRIINFEGDTIRVIEARSEA